MQDLAVGILHAIDVVRVVVNMPSAAMAATARRHLMGWTSLVPSGIDTTSSRGVVMPIRRACSTTWSMPTICPRRT